jgi:hypothetical protein
MIKHSWRGVFAASRQLGMPSATQSRPGDPARRDETAARHQNGETASLDRFIVSRRLVMTLRSVIAALGQAEQE